MSARKPLKTWVRIEAGGLTLRRAKTFMQLYAYDGKYFLER